MLHSVKLVINTLASSAKIVVIAVTTIFATRIALEQLGASDFGLFNLVAGIIVMLSFLSGALSISGQRYFSIALGEDNNVKLNEYFNSSLGIHTVVAICISLLLFISGYFLFDGFLNISIEQKPIAIKVYNILILSSFLTIMTIPFSALTNAYEDLGVLACIDGISSITKLVGAYSLVWFQDKIVAYALFMLGSVFIKALLEYIWCRRTYNTVRVSVSHIYNKNIWKDMFGFVSWNTLGSFAVVVRNQGIAILLNIYFGTIVNAAYGIANQVNSLILSFASALTTVFAPTIIKSYGAGNFAQTRSTAILSSKLSFLLSSMMALPIIVFLKPILKIWLDDVPSGTYTFTLYVILCFLILQLYPGLNRAIYATGKIKRYQIQLSLILIGVIPIGILVYAMGWPDYSVLIVLLISQFFTLSFTVNISSKLLNLDSNSYWLHSVLKPICLFAGMTLLCRTIDTFHNITHIYPILIASGIYMMLYGVIYYLVILNRSEQVRFENLLKHFKSKIKS